MVSSEVEGLGATPLRMHRLNTNEIIIVNETSSNTAILKLGVGLGRQKGLGIPCGARIVATGGA